MNKNLQDYILNEMRKNGIVVTIFLVNGFQITGEIKSFDSYVIVVEAGGKTQMIYKHAISTMAPSRNIPSFNVNSGE
ncbi:MAG: RNA chaperone Hfq [Clostridiales bacterium]|jgi:host factor-I protein|nr:RNA chaperone Hfq [Clostridiales bacterium]